MGTVLRFQATLVTSRKVAWALPARNYVGQFCLGRGVKYPDFRGRGLRYGCGGCFIQTHNKGRLKTVIAGLPGCNPCFQTTLVTSRKVAWTLPARNISVYSVFWRWAKYPDFRGRSPRYGCGGYFIQTRNRRSSENGHIRFAWLQSVVSDDLDNEWKVVWALPAKNMLVNSVFGRWAKYPIFVGGAHATVEVRVLCKFIIKGRLKMRIASFSKTTISFSDDLLCIWIFNQTAKSAATQSQSRPATCFAAAVL